MKFTVEIEKGQPVSLDGEEPSPMFAGMSAYRLRIDGADVGMAMGTRADLGPVRDAFWALINAKFVGALKAVDES